MLDASRKSKANEYCHLIRIAGTPSYPPEYAERLCDTYLSKWEKHDSFTVQELSGQSALYALQGAIRGK